MSKIQKQKKYLQSDQKEIIFKTVLAFIKKYKAHSLLDIGAGGALLAARLSRQVSEYVAVEKNIAYTKKLKTSGLKVIEGIFPISVPGQYDIVLISHAIPESKTEYKDFVKSAWQKVRKGGYLIIITFKGAVDNLVALEKAFYSKQRIGDKGLYAELIKNLKPLGQLNIKKIESKIYTKHVAPLLKLIAESLNLEKRIDILKLEKILAEKYETRNGYVFPMQHLVLSIRKYK